MSASVRIDLLPLGRRLEVNRGTSLQDVLFDQGVEFPCGGRGRCKGCRVRVLEGALEAGPEDRQLLSAAEIEAGWRLACRLKVTRPLRLELAQWEATILSDDRPFSFKPREGLGVAVDLGTTTIVAQLLDLRDGHVLAVRSALNAQAQHGADVMSRIDFAMTEGGQPRLERLVRGQIGSLIRDLVRAGGRAGEPVAALVVVGNTAMHHLFCGVSVAPLSHHPFEPVQDGHRVFDAEELGWALAGRPRVHFLPCLGGFVGSDILAGILATQLHRSQGLVGLVDLGTNGEIVLGNSQGLLCASTAAGPAFEGARISCGMRAATGAIAEVTARARVLECRVLGHGEARGICGSGLVDAAGAALGLGLVLPSGRLARDEGLSLTPKIALTQGDIRELQLAKGAIAAGLRLLLERRGARREDLQRLYLAGAFGNYINRASARRIGLLDFPLDRVHPAGNTALRGAKLALFELEEHGGAFPELRAQVRHVPLNEDPAFQDVFAEEMAFPPASAVEDPGASPS